MNICLPIFLACHNIVTSNSVFEGLALRNNTSAEDQIGMNWNGALQRRYGSLLFLWCSFRTCFQWGYDVDESFTLFFFAEGTCMICRWQTSLPGRGPDLEEMHPIFRMLVLF